MKQPFKKSFDKKEGSRKTENAPFKKEYRKKEFREDKPENKKSEFPERRKRREDFDNDKPFKKRERPLNADGEKKFGKGKDKFAERKSGDKKRRSNDLNSFEKTDRSSYKNPRQKPFDKADGKSFDKTTKKSFHKTDRKEEEYRERRPDRKKGGQFEDKKDRKPVKEEATTPKQKDTAKSIDEPMTLNKYIAHSGECSRRDAAELVKQGKVRVNGELILEPGYRVTPDDTVTLSGKKMTPQKNLVYVLLNKPKDYITTTEDPQERKTVMDLVANAEAGRLYPVGRLDRNTTGLLLLTNDGALAHKLSHPSYQIRKVYHVTLNKNLTKADYEKIFKGLELEDGLVQVDEIAYLEERNEVGVEIHSGRNRIVRRIFESLGYEVEKLDRVIYAGLTKKNLPRGKWRFLDEKEIIFLKHFKS